MKRLPNTFPFRNIFTEFLKKYSSSTTYWYIPKVRTLNEQNILAIRQIIELVFNEFLGSFWNQGTQDKILKCLVERKILSPTKKGTKVDRTALIRIWKKLLEVLGLLWVQDNMEIVITDAGLEVIANKGKRARITIEQQIAKYQYPNPSVSTEYGGHFGGIIPHIFLLQVLQRCNYILDPIEYELFVNLAKSQDDIDIILKYIHSWRDLKEKEQEIILGIAQRMIMVVDKKQPELFEDDGKPTRFNRVDLNSSYQKSFFTFPSYLGIKDGNIVCHHIEKVNELLDQILPSLKITEFRTLGDWFAYFGDPTQKPSWLTYLISTIEDTTSAEEAKTIIEKHKDFITEDEVEVIERAQIEKDIETFYFKHPNKLESGLKVLKKGRQFSTPIGRIDLLCISQNKEYVIVEVKANEANDAVFGQILRYIGWIHRNIRGAESNVRGIILASQFPETARYSRIGLLKDDYQTFIKFKEHGLNVQDS